MNVGGPITLLQDSLLVHARWGGHRDEFKSFVDSYHTYRFSMGGRVAGPDVALADEGITWCCGHVHDTDPDGAALLAGEALKDEKGTTLKAIYEFTSSAWSPDF